MLRYDAQGQQFVGERVCVAAAVFAQVQQQMVEYAGIPPESAFQLLLNEVFWKFDRRAVPA